MNIGAVLARRIYWPIVQRMKGEYAARALNELLESQWAKSEVLAQRQWERVGEMVRLAAQEVPYYRERYESAGRDTLRADFSYNDFVKLPMVEKKDLRDELARFLNPSYRGRITFGKTSGSTGESLLMYYSTQHESFSEAARWRAKSWWGVDIGAPHATIWGRPYIGAMDRVKQRVKSRLMNTLLLSAFDFRSEALSGQWEEIRRFRPAIIYAYPTAVAALARYLDRERIDAKALGLKVVMVTAETLTAVDREIIERVFGCKAANEYGCSETGGFAYECPRGNWHLSPELVFVEYLDPLGSPVRQGDTGEIVVTDLRNEYMPLIRYRTGDRGMHVAGVCPCGRTLPMMRVSAAKVSDTVRLGAGRAFSSEIFDYINLSVVKQFPSSIVQFRVIQLDHRRFLVEVVGGGGDTGAATTLLGGLMKRQLGEDIVVEFRQVPAIEREPSGKIRYFVSKVPNESES